jgi:NAD(P)-dependent dehydrogenase (short-subunit alcohol dehydrogenase family)
MTFEGKVALITGAGKGLGRAYAKWLAARGATVIVNNRTHPGKPSSARAVVEEIKGAGGTAFYDENAVNDQRSAVAMVDGAYQQFGHLDVLICNAGIAVTAPFAELTLKKMREVMDINFWGSLYPLFSALQRMLAADYGRIVLTTSQTALYGYSGTALYASSKGAVLGLGRALAYEIAEKANLRLNVVMPVAATAMARRPVSEEVAALVSPDKVAPAVGWLCSDACDKSGMVFHVGGGRVRRVITQETIPVELPDEGMATCWPALDRVHSTEAVNARDSVNTLIPEWR